MEQMGTIVELLRGDVELLQSNPLQTGGESVE